MNIFWYIIAPLIVAILTWTGKRMYARIRSKQHPRVNIILMRRAAGYVTPKPLLCIKLEGLKIETNQPNGFYSFEAILHTATGVLNFSIPKHLYSKWMDLGESATFEMELSNWDYWEKSDTGGKSKILADAHLTSWLFINDRRCTLTKSQEISSIEFWDQG